ncbi:MAG: hypothetical protein HXS46_08615 [Theionarchaea archaeon]|nr:MAG: hypothetical protein AYK18_05490 [Theionarchaea archaeon DG-70]MBU7010739.1 hypothetical protein [Theionarchaea archaeon]
MTRENRTKELNILGPAEHICIWKDAAECNDCHLDEVLFCRPKIKYMLYFGLTAMLGIIPAVMGILLSEYTTLGKIAILGSWVVYAAFFFTIWESRMLCNHCPYYANDAQKSLHCPIDKGKLKTSHYDPGPLSTSEKGQFTVGALILIGYIHPFLVIKNQILFTALSIAGIIVWIMVIQKKVCTDCVNFGCPLNRVPTNIRDRFLNRNPVIKEAWEEKGYKIKND